MNIAGLTTQLAELIQSMETGKGTPLMSKDQIDVLKQMLTLVKNMVQDGIQPHELDKLSMVLGLIEDMLPEGSPVKDKINKMVKILEKLKDVLEDMSRSVNGPPMMQMTNLDNLIQNMDKLTAETSSANRGSDGVKFDPDISEGLVNLVQQLQQISQGQQPQNLKQENALFGVMPGLRQPSQAVPHENAILQLEKALSSEILEISTDVLTDKMLGFAEQKNLLNGSGTPATDSIAAGLHSFDPQRFV